MIKPFDPVDWLERAEADGTRFYVVFERMPPLGDGLRGWREHLWEDRTGIHSDRRCEDIAALWEEYREGNNATAVKVAIAETRGISTVHELTTQRREALQ